MLDLALHHPIMSGKHPTRPQSVLGLALLRGQALGGSVLPSSLPTRSILHPYHPSIVPAGLRARASSSSFVEVAARPNGTYLSFYQLIVVYPAVAL